MKHALDATGTHSPVESPATDYCLVHMPMFDMQFPPLGLSLLQSILKTAGLQGRVLHASLQFGEDITTELSQTLFLCREALLPDWMFAHMVFPELAARDKVDAYIAELQRKTYVYQFIDAELIRSRLMSCRQWAEEFVGKIVAAVLDLQPKVVGCGVFHTQYIPVLAFLNRLRQQAPDIVSVIGGPHCGGVVGQTTHRQFRWVDYVVAGDGDELIVPLFQAILDQGRNIDPGQARRGVLVPGHRETDYPPADQWFAITADLTALPPPDHQDYLQTIRELPKVRKFAQEPVLTFESSRGCYWAQKKPCSFCSVDQGTRVYRTKSAEQVLAELAYLSQKYGIRCFLATDSIMDQRWFQTFLPTLAARQAPYGLFYEVPASLTREQVALAADAGVVWFQPGIESFDSRILRLMNKGTAAWQSVQMLKWCRQYGVRVTWNLLHGFPGELDLWYADMAKLLPALTHLQPPTAVGAVNFCRNSAYDQATDPYLLRLKPASVWRHIIPWPDDRIAHVLYSFVADTAGNGPAKSTGLGAVQEAVKKWRLRFSMPEQPVLQGKWMHDQLIVEDSRGDHQVTHQLRGLHQEILLLGDAAPRKQAVLDQMRERGYQSGEIENAINELVASHLQLEMDERLVTVAILGECRPLADNGRQVFPELTL